jgi:lipopolysaccharide/colanic/teichoic acid biosynthesis glycosyltransferase
MKATYSTAEVLEEGDAQDYQQHEVVAHELTQNSSPLDAGELPIVDFRPTLYTKRVKPVFDILIAAVALLVLALPMLAIAVMVRVTMGNPVLFRQRRVGLNGKVFNVLKFRTMNHDRRLREMDVDSEKRRTHKSDEDPRHTAIGRFMRRYSVDELPQLINVLRGEMSLIGPRPELESVVARHYTEALHQRHLVKPGLTGLWQVSARGEGEMHENGGWDIHYLETISAASDLKILLRTFSVVLGSNKGR